MIAAIAEKLSTPVDMVEEWEAPKFFRYFDAMTELMKLQAPKREEG